MAITILSFGLNVGNCVKTGDGPLAIAEALRARRALFFLTTASLMPAHLEAGVACGREDDSDITVLQTDDEFRARRARETVMDFQKAAWDKRGQRCDHGVRRNIALLSVTPQLMAVGARMLSEVITLAQNLAAEHGQRAAHYAGHGVWCKCARETKSAGSRSWARAPPVTFM